MSPDIQDYRAELHKTATLAESLLEVTAAENIRKIAKKAAENFKKYTEKPKKLKG